MNTTERKKKDRAGCTQIVLFCCTVTVILTGDSFNSQSHELHNS